MPGNEVVINGSEKLSWYVGDSNMPKLIQFLDEEVGIRNKKENKEE